MKEFSVEFHGCLREFFKSNLPTYPGIYCVYTCTYNPVNNKVVLKKLVYIGQSDNINYRINHHERLPDWKKHLKDDEILCYSYANIDGDKERVEAAMIYKHKPPCNIEYRDSFPFPDTIVNISGITRFLFQSFAVKRTE